MKIIYATVGLFIFAVSGAFAQNNAYEGEIYYDSSIRKTGDKVNLELTVDVGNMSIGRQQMVVMTPTIKPRSEAGRNMEMRQVIIAGPKRYRAVKREIAYGTAEFGQDPIIIKRNRRSPDRIEIFMETQFEEWFRDADLEIHESTRGCATCNKFENDVPLSEVVRPQHVPALQTVVVEPPVELVKERSETFVAMINYQVDKYQILKNYKNNAAVFRDVDRVMTELINDPYLTVTKFNVVGYASPEGYFDRNQTLSENRAKAFLGYLNENYGYNIKNIAYKGMGEDWDGLYKLVEESDIAEREQVLDIIKNTGDVVLRKRRLQSLSGGSTYRYLLENMYPQLRRNEFEIAYIARGFDIEEAKALIRTRPQLLSLNEMYLVAQTYEKNSEDYTYVFDVAARMFPEDPVAKINAAAMEIEAGAYDWAIERLQHLDGPEALNNLGVAYARKGMYDEAVEALRTAVEAGNAEAAHNLREITMWLNGTNSAVTATNRP